MADKWSNIIASDKSGNSATIDVSAWLGKATLDACVEISALCARDTLTNQGAISYLKRIGAGAFEYDFGALDGTGNPFTKSYTNLLYDHLPCLHPKIRATLTVCSVR